MKNFLVILAFITVWVFGFQSFSLWKDALNVNRYKVVDLGFSSVKISGIIDTKTGRVWKIYKTENAIGFEPIPVENLIIVEDKYTRVLK